MIYSSSSGPTLPESVSTPRPHDPSMDVCIAACLESFRACEQCAAMAVCGDGAGAAGDERLRGCVYRLRHHLPGQCRFDGASEPFARGDVRDLRGRLRTVCHGLRTPRRAPLSGLCGGLSAE